MLERQVVRSSAGDGLGSSFRRSLAPPATASNMIASLLLSTLIWSAPVTAAPLDGVAAHLEDSEVETRIAAAGTDIAKLQALAAEYEQAKDRNAAKLVHLRVIEVDPNNEVSRAALRHQFYDGRWFESFVELAKFKREEDERMAKDGLVRWRDGWAPSADLPYLSLGWVRNAAGEWEDPVLVAEQKQIEAWQAAGYQFRADDNSWIAPEDFEHWTNLEWKCGEEWVSLERANEFHSDLEQMWQIAGEHFITATICDWDTGNIARWHADRTAEHLMRVFGTAPQRKPHFVMLPDLAAYNAAAGDVPALLADSEGYSSLQGSYFADLCFDHSKDPVRYMGCGVCYFDRTDEKLAKWGPLWIRWAAAQSYIDAIDPSWRTIGPWVELQANGDARQYGADFWAEKRIPRWLRYGAATYVERFIPDPLYALEEDQVWDLRNEALADLKQSGGLRKIEEVFAFRLSLDDVAGSARLYQEAGLIVAFMLDGAPEDGGLRALHSAFRRMLANGSDEQLAAVVRDLEAALIEREPAIRAFARF